MYKVIRYVLFAFKRALFSNVNKVGSAPNRHHPYKYMHFSFDDVILMLKDLTDNSTSYASLFDNSSFAFLKKLHDQYGAVFTLNLFYVHAASGWNLGYMTTHFKEEFRQNAEWLKFSFHAYDNATNYGKGNATDALSHYNLVTDAIRTFSSEHNLDSVTRLGFFGGNLDVCRALRDAAYNVKGFLTSDDGRKNDYYLNAGQRKEILKYGECWDTSESLYFVRTSIRIENFKNPTSEIINRMNEHSGQMDVLEVFTHEGHEESKQTQIESVFKWALQNGYKFDYPMNHMPEVSTD